MYVEEKRQGEEVKIDEVGKILLEAADYIEQHGWCQKVYQNGLGNACIMGALLRVARTTSGDGKIMSRLRKYLGVTSLENWNDASGRTKEQVVAALRGAARPRLPTPAIAQMANGPWRPVPPGSTEVGESVSVSA